MQKMWYMINYTNCIDNPRHKLILPRNEIALSKGNVCFSFCIASVNSYKKQRYQQKLIPKKTNKGRKGTSNWSKKTKATETAREVAGPGFGP